MFFGKTPDKQKTFKEKYTLEDRQKSFRNINSKYPDKIPVVVEKSVIKSGNNIPDIDRSKFLVPADLNVSAMSYVVRKRIKLEPHHALVLYFKDSHIQPSMKLISEIYKEEKDEEDGFLYITYAGENTFG